MENVKLDNGNWIINDNSKYGSGLLIIVQKPTTDQLANAGLKNYPDGDSRFADNWKWNCKSWEGVPELLKNFKDSKPSVYRGRMFKTRKGRTAFEMSSDGEYLLCAFDWGGAFSKSWGLETPVGEKYSDKLLFQNSRTSNGGRMGVIWEVYKESDLINATVNIEDF